MGYTPSFTPQYENGWEDLPIEETPITAEALNAYDDAIENIEEYLASDESQANLADAYDETETYAVGDYVIYGGDLYKCTTAISTAEEWDSTHWTPCLITDEMGHGGGGSNVSITPTLSTGTKIADFEIDGQTGELYAPTGGGGNANIWTGTKAEYEQQASQIPDDTVVLITDDEEHTQAFDIYSTDEQVIGTWVDGKPLYRKVLPTITFNNNYEYTHNLGIKYYINVGGNCTVNDGTNPLPFPFLQSRYNGYCNFQNTTPNSVTLDSSWNNNAVDCYIEYTKLSDYS